MSQLLYAGVGVQLPVSTPERQSAADLMHDGGGRCRDQLVGSGEVAPQLGLGCQLLDPRDVDLAELGSTVAKSKEIRGALGNTA